MDPLRFGPGEVEAFHPLVKLCKHTSDQHLRPAFPTYDLAVRTPRVRLGLSDGAAAGDLFGGLGVEPAS